MCPIRLGTNTVTALGSGASSKCSTSSISQQPLRLTVAPFLPMRRLLGPRAIATGNSWGMVLRNRKLEDEAGDIARTTEVIAQYAGRRPRGWLGPGLTETWETPDLLVEAGYEYVCDWVLDDQPVLLNTRSGPILSVPFTQECNDVAMMLIQHHKASEYADRAIDQFEQLRQDAKDSARVMAVVIHAAKGQLRHKGSPGATSTL
jgi:hypothetical protein